MSFVGRARKWLRAAASRSRLEREMRDEMDAHLMQAAERFKARGMSDADARQAALREFGHLGSIEQSAREARGAQWITSLSEDLRHAMRYFARTPLASITIILTLALGIGFSSAGFSVLNGVMYRPPPGVPDDPELVRIRGRSNVRPYSRKFSLDELNSYAAQRQTFSQVVGWSETSVVIDTRVPDREVHRFHERQNLQIVVNGMHRDVVNHARPGLLALLGAVGFVLLIACANIANLLLVRASERSREIAVRAAVGSGRGRIVAQMLTESLVLSVAGGILGVMLAWQSIGVVRALSPANLPRIESLAIDARALAFAAGVSILAAIVFGLAPALRAVRGNLADGLRDRGSDSGGVRGNKLRTALVVSEVALSLVLLIGAGLMVRSFAQIQRVNPGFDAQNVVTFNAPVQFLKYLTTQARANFANQLGDRLAAIPGVEAVGGVTPLPLAGGDQYSVGSYGRIGDPDDVYQANKADYKAVLPGYFEAMKIGVVKGRTFVRGDNEDQALDVAVIDEKFATRVFGNADPLGAQILVDHFNEKTFSLERLPVTIVGVVANVRSSSLAAEGRETIYVPYVFVSFLPMVYVVRTTVAPSSLISRIRDEVKGLDPDVPIADLTTVESWVTKAMAPTRFLLALNATFAGLALVLASLGLYGVMSYSARQRTREIGVRAALGASDRDVLRLILGQGMLLAGIGIVLGLAASFALTRVVRSYLVGVSSTDPVAFVGVSAVLLMVAAVASYLPARRASQIDPSHALREE